MRKVSIGGMMVGYYLLCPRKAWLSLNGLWMEHESETVALGRLIDEASYTRAQKQLDLAAEAPDGTQLVGRVDWSELRDGILHETKKGKSAEEAHIWQLRFYLWLLKRCRVTRADGSLFTGMINYPVLRQKKTVKLEPGHEQRLEEIVAGLCEMAAMDTPPPRLERRSLCKRCAFEELCYA